MKNIKSAYTEFHLKNKSNHLYPTEWVIRTMLGNYPELKLDKSRFKNGKILDLGFGDCRNMSFLNNCGLSIYGVDITEETVALGYETLRNLNIEAQLKVGSNINIPYDDQYFDYILASSSCYYIDDNSTFSDNIQEILRVLKGGGSLIANFPAFVPFEKIPVSFILKDAIIQDDGHVIIKNDIYGIRNGYKFKTFHSKEDINKFFDLDFEDISIGMCLDNYFGIQINSYIFTGKKKKCKS